MCDFDQSKFWSILNRRRRRKSAKTDQIKVGDKVYRSRGERLCMWTEYFTAMYSNESASECYDKDHYRPVCTQVKKIAESSFDDPDVVMKGQLFTSDEIASVVSKLKLGKKGGFDSLTNEHVKYGGPVLYRCLAKLFNAMYSNEYIPQGMKRGLIITLYKGSRKSDDRKNYRGISLLPVLAKLFDNVLLNRINE